MPSRRASTSRPPSPPPRPRDERGASFSTFVASFVLALILTSGLVVDGGAQMAAARRASVTAGEVARAASDAAATRRLAGADGAAAALAAARARAAGAPGMSVAIEVRDGVVHVRASTSAPTVFLSIISIDTLPAYGEAEADLFATGERP